MKLFSNPFARRTTTPTLAVLPRGEQVLGAQVKIGNLDLLGLTAAAFQFQNAPQVNGAPWVGTNDAQHAYLANYDRYLGVSRGLTTEELKAFASTDHNAINAFLAKAGFGSVQLRPFGPGDVGAVSVIDTLWAWAVNGYTNESLKIKGKPAFQLSTREHGVRFSNENAEEAPVVRIPTDKPGDTIFISQGLTETGFALYDTVSQWADLMYSSSNTWAGVCLPMVDLNNTNDLSWFIGTKCGGFQISQAIQAVRLKMNHKGGRSGSGTAIGGTRSATGPTFMVFDEPFTLAYYRKGFGVIAVHQITESDFKDPGELKFAA